AASRSARAVTSARATATKRLRGCCRMTPDTTSGHGRPSRPPLGEFRHQPTRRTDLLPSSPGVLLRAAPAGMGNIEDDPVRVAELDLVEAAALDVGLAHQPFAAGRLDALLCRLRVVHPDAEMMEPDMVAPGTLRRFVGFEM